MGTLLLILALWTGGPAQEPLPQSLAFVGGTLLPMDDERRLEDYNVIVREGRIVELGPRTTTAVPEGARIIDATGKFLMPGLVDMHVHTWSKGDLALFLAHGVTTVRNLFGNPMHLGMRAKLASGELLGPTLVTAGPIVDGYPPVWPGSLVALDAEQGRAAVKQHVEAGYDFVKVYSRLPREAYEALIEAAAQAGLAVDGHVPDAVGFERALEAGQRVAEHMSGIGLAVAVEGAVVERGWLGDNLAWQHVDPARQEQWISRIRERGTWLCPTFVVLQKMVDKPTFERELERDVMRYVPAFTRQFWRGLADRTPVELREATQASLAGRMAFVRDFARAGGRVLLGTDVGNPLLVPGYSAHEELANLVAAGLTPHQALRAGTRAPAECLGQAGVFGAIGVGLRADLLLLEGDPSADVANASNPLGVMVRGRWLERSELLALLVPLEPGSGR
jgi:imidazolonepropionase-like amidohydrolase